MPRFLTLLLIVLLAVPLSGCLYSREIAHTRRDIERQTGADLEREMVVNLGPMSLRTAQWVAGWVPEDDAQMAQAYLRDIRRVKVGVYEVRAGGGSFEQVDLRRFERMQRRGWELLAKVREDDELVYVFYRERHGRIRDLYVMALDDDELVLARVRGNLSRLVTRALQDHADDWTNWSDWDTLIEAGH